MMFQIPGYLTGPEAAASGPATGDPTSDGATVGGLERLLFPAPGEKRKKTVRSYPGNSCSYGKCSFTDDLPGKNGDSFP